MNKEGGKEVKGKREPGGRKEIGGEGENQDKLEQRKE